MASAIPIYGMVAIVLFIGVYMIINGNKSKKDREIASRAMYKKLYDMLSYMFFTQRQLYKISARLSTLSIYNRNELQELATKYMLVTSSLSLGLVCASIILFKDTVSTLICIAFAILVNNILVSKQIEKVNLQVYKALKFSISSIRQEYLELGDVAESIDNADISSILGKPFEQIYGILTGADGEIALLKFYEASPFRPLQTLAGICFNIQNYGDSTDEIGQSNFVSALTMLTMDINSEIQRLVTMKNRFGHIEYIPFLPIFSINLIENYFIGIMPGTALVYNGVLGYIGRILTLISCIICYSTVANINSSAPIKEDDRTPWITSILNHTGFRQFIANITPKNAKARRLNKSLKAALSRKTLEHLYTEKLVWAVGAFIVAVICTISTISLSREFLLNSTQQLSLVATSEMDGFSKEQVLALDYSYFNREKDWSDNEFKEVVKSSMPGLTDLQIIDQMKRIKDKEKSLDTSFFHWYYTLVMIGASCIAWFAPNIGLMLRRFLVYTEAEEDFLQIQTLVAILMNTEMDTLDTLWQMCQHSRIHKTMLLYCYHSYPSNPEKEIIRLQSKTPLIEFKRFIGKLGLTISNLSLREAYSDLKIERDHMLRVREISMYASIDKKRGLCGILSMIPLGFLVVFELLVPLGYLGFKEFTNALSSMQS